ncbi:MAG: glycosyltransferase family 2 protein [Planctomycetota bacterium]
MSIDLSVIIPVYKAEPYIQRCIEGLLAQDLPRDRFEVLFVDNNSPDRSAEIIRQYDHDVRLLHEPKQGAYAARNKALHEAKGKAIVFTDPDCVPASDWLSAAWDALQQPGAQIALGRVYPPERSEALRLLHLYVHQRHRYIFEGDDPTLYYGHTNNLAATREAVDACCPFEERARGGDTIFVQRVVEQFGVDAVRYFPEMQVLHLEVETVRDFLHKSYLYGKSWSKYSQVVRARPVTTSERLMIWKRVVVEEGLSLLERARMWAVLGAGAASFKWGTYRGGGKSSLQAENAASFPEKEELTSHG